MKLALLTFLFALPLLARGQNIPTPKMAVSVPFKEDKTEWGIQSSTGNEFRVLVEFTPKGQRIETWKEMVAQEITFIDDLPKYLSMWKEMLRNSDPKIELEEKKNADGTITVTYKSKAFNEFSLRRFFKGEDGIYALAYHVKLNLLDKDRVSTWNAILAQASLVPNPERQKAPAGKE